MAAILTGQLAPGEALPTERELSSNFGVSRQTVREAIRSLQEQGLLSQRPQSTRSPTTVSADVTRGPLRNAMANFVRLQEISLKDLVELRCAIESSALRLSAFLARSRDTGHLEAARAALRMMSEPGLSPEAFDDADVQFHLALVASSGNRIMEVVMLAMRDAMRAHLLSALESIHAEGRGPQQTRCLIDQHLAILRAVESGNGERAARLGTHHIVAFYERTLSEHHPT